MKELKICFAVLAAALMAMGIASQAQAFHSGGVAECEGCHSMHNSFEGTVNVTGTSYGQGSGPYLLKASDQSGACLNCHGAGTTLSSYHVSTEGVGPNETTTVPQQLTPGGDFSWLKKTLTITIRKSTLLRDGERFGHNIVATDFGYDADAVVTQAPGGSYPSDKLACTSCHDPHGRTRRFADGSYATTGLPIFNSGSYNNSNNPIATVSAVGAYRILGGTGYAPKSNPGYPFGSQVPAAVVASSYNRTEMSSAGLTQTGIAYGEGMSEWCANCHTAFLSNGYTSGMAGLRHPAGNAADLTAAVVANYNTYVSSGIMTGAATNAWSTLAPFEIGSSDYAVLKPLARNEAPSNSARQYYTTGAATTNNVACLTCHRAHASAFESSLRFFYLNEFMTVADASNAAIYDSSTTENKVNYGLTQAMQQQAYYGRPATTFGPYSRMYCNKCHAKD